MSWYSKTVGEFPGVAPALNNASTTLILGGARSGKSAFAERLAAPAGRPVYLATADPGDEEMKERIRLHRERRGARWTTVEEPLEVAAALARLSGPDTVAVVDCLTLWVSNLMHTGRDVAAESERLVEALASCGCAVILISNEVGLGIVPDNPLSRAFRDHLGRLHQAIAARADRVYFVVAGIPLTVKDLTRGP